MYLSIKTGYVWGKGHTQELNDIFRTHMRDLAAHLGMNVCEPDISAQIIYSHDLTQVVYCHPMELTGEVETNTEISIGLFMDKLGIEKEWRAEAQKKDYEWLRNSVKRELNTIAG